MSSVDFTLAFDSELLEVTAVEPGSALMFGFVSTEFSRPGELRISVLFGFSPVFGPVDVVLLSFPNGEPTRHVKLVAHRVLALDDDYVWTKGDSSGTPDPPVPWSRVLACATTLETDGAFAIPLANAPMRALGLLMSSLYPRLVRAYRTVWPRKPRKDAFGCAS